MDLTASHIRKNSASVLVEFFCCSIGGDEVGCLTYAAAVHNFEGLAFLDLKATMT